jgi:uncharacterized protein YndB with AHSA1/START domain
MTEMTDLCVTRTARFDAPREEVWEAITDPDALSCWLADDVDLDVRPGGVGRVTLPGGGTRSVLVTEVEDERRLSLLWWDTSTDALSSVEMTLADGDDGTELVVVERLLAPPATAAQTRVTMSMRWGCACTALSNVCSSGAVASGAVASRAVASRAVASRAVASARA